ncbi:uncharacterized protein K460DRAFT_416165 [Cucurbitaria berberidis CBS 394.84]|uniref:Uncharacterized protein n=1 Tax=Cucurbitaria berberidis CBS 394.84 TaxID=1168544 RepID=A0A9P4L7C2_9PLEO|nr:uncharacterized protein K460DRAFT_416165 [Cucurbitaria berberidis CBS 394.84]KAF1844790.1 hypothetical protein K460DRAFT_416165 [Cucurbitaria berberidis CBS 394.84]
MSYLLEFPTSSLPHNAHSPPYVVFAIQGNEIVSKLPPRIPLNVVLHFAPKLNQWVLPCPSTAHLPLSIARLALRTPYIGIDILSEDIEPTGLEWILSKMLMASGLAYPKSLFHVSPTITTSISIHKTWLALDLPIAGIENLHTHIQSRLMLGPAVTLAVVMAVWGNFPQSSHIVRAMGLNFIRSHIDLEYTQRETSSIRHWYLKSAERCRFFASLECQFPKFGESQDLLVEKAAKGNATLSTSARTGKMMEKTGTKTVSQEEKKERRQKDGAAMRTRLRRTKSDVSIRSVETVIWDPPSESNKDEGATEGEVNDKDATTETKTGPEVSEALQDVSIEGEAKKTSLVRLQQVLIPDLKRLSELAEAATESSELENGPLTNLSAVPKRYATLRKKAGREELDAERRL